MNSRKKEHLDHRYIIHTKLLCLAQIVDADSLFFEPMFWYFPEAEKGPLSYVRGDDSTSQFRCRPSDHLVFTVNLLGCR